MLSMWISLGDCSVQMGGLTYLAGSHHWGVAAERADALHRKQAITADLPARADRLALAGALV